MRRLTLLLAVLVGLGAVAACSGGDGEGVTTRASEPTTAAAAPIELPTTGEIVFTRKKNGVAVYVMRSDGSRVRLLVRDAANPAVSPDGRRIAFERGAAIWIAARDGSSQRRLTKPVSGYYDFDPAWSADGTSVFFAREKPGWGSSLFSIRRDGTGLRRITRVTEEGHVGEPTCQTGPAPSPYGRLLAYEDWWCPRGDQADIAISTTAGAPASTRFRFPFDAGLLWEPAWAPDGRALAYENWMLDEGMAPSGIYVSASNGGKPRRVVGGAMEPAWSPDSAWIAFTRGDRGDIWLVRADGKGVRRLTRGGADDGDPAWLPPLR